MAKARVKRGYLRLSQTGQLRLRIVQIEVEEVALPALIHIRMRYCQVVHGDFLKEK